MSHGLRGMAVGRLRLSFGLKDQCNPSVLTGLEMEAEAIRDHLDLINLNAHVAPPLTHTPVTEVRIALSGSHIRGLDRFAILHRRFRGDRRRTNRRTHRAVSGAIDTAFRQARHPAFGFEATREAAMEAFARSWHRKTGTTLPLPDYSGASAQGGEPPTLGPLTWEAPVTTTPGVFPF